MIGWELRRTGMPRFDHRRRSSYTEPKFESETGRPGIGGANRQDFTPQESGADA